MISSAMPSQRYSWSFAGLMSENGSTAIETGAAPLPADDAGVEAGATAASPALRSPSMRLSTSCGSSHFSKNWRPDCAKSSFWASRSRRACGGGRGLAELAVGRGEHRAPPEAVRHVALHGLVHGRTVVRQAVLVEAEDQLVPPGVVRVLLHRPADEAAATLPVSGEGDEEDGLVAAVERVQGQGPLGGAPARRLSPCGRTARPPAPDTRGDWTGRGPRPAGRRRGPGRASQAAG